MYVEFILSLAHMFLGWVNKFNIFSFFFFHLLTGKKTISLNIQSVTTYKTISNVIGYLKGAVFPGRYPFVICIDYLFHNGWESQLGSESCFAR